LLVDEDLGLYRRKIETKKLQLVQPVVIKSLHKLLIGYPNWIVIALCREFGGWSSATTRSWTACAETISRRNLRW
jgi:hypothetical protein